MFQIERESKRKSCVELEEFIWEIQGIEKKSQGVDWWAYWTVLVDRIIGNGFGELAEM